MGQELYELPEGWEWSDLNSACSLITDGAHASPKTQLIGKPYITVRDIDKMGNIDLVGCKKISDDAFDSLTKGKCSPSEGSVLFSKDGTVGKVALVKNYDPFVVLSSLAILDPKSDLLTSEYLRWFMLSPELQENAIGKKTGAAIKRIVLRTIKTMEIPLPPLSEQKRIVAKLDAIFTRIDTAITHLQQTLKLSKALFASALDEVFISSGSKEKLPEQWIWAVIGDHCCFENGDRGKNYPSRSAFVDSGIPVINTGNLSDNRIDTSTLNYITRERYDLLGGGKVREGDILFCLRGSLGKSAIVRDIYEGAIASSLVIVRSEPTLNTEYLQAYFNSHLCALMVKKYDNGSAQPNLSSRNLKKFQIPLPPLSEQKQVVEHLDSLAGRTRTLEATTQEKINDLTALKASLLDAAFKGQL